jgi:acyl-CoA thioester hydrolase
MGGGCYPLATEPPCTCRPYPGSFPRVARLVLQLPQQLPFSTVIEVRVTDLNYGAHLGNDAMLSLIHEARWRFFRSLGQSEGNIFGARLVLGDAAIVYKKEAFAGDQLRFSVGLFDPGRVGCDLGYRAVRIADDALVVEAKTGLVFLDPASGRPVALPDAIRKLAAPA